MQQQHKEQLLVLQAAVDNNARVTELRERRQENAAAESKREAQRSVAHAVEAKDAAIAATLDCLVAKAAAKKAVNEKAEMEKDLQQLCTPRAQWGRGRPRARAAAIYAAIVDQGPHVPGYWRAQIELRDAQILQLRGAGTELEKQVVSLQKRAVGALMKRSAQPVVNNKTTKNLKSFSYGLETRQHFIDIASLNIPPKTLVKLYRKLHVFYFPHLKELDDWEVPTAAYMKQCSEMLGHAAESCAAHDLAEGVEYCVGMDGSTKDAWHLMTANAKVRTAADVTSGHEGKNVYPRGPQLAAKGGGTGGADSQRDYWLHTLEASGERLDEWRASAAWVSRGVAQGEVEGEAWQPRVPIPAAKEVTNAKTVATINDGENTAKSAATAVAEDKERALIKYMGQEAWDALTPAARARKCVVAEWACHDHICALFSKWGVKFENEFLSDMIGDSIEELSSVLRIDGKVSSLNYQAGKLLKDGNDAAHYSQGRETCSPTSPTTQQLTTPPTTHPSLFKPSSSTNGCLTTTLMWWCPTLAGGWSGGDSMPKWRQHLPCTGFSDF
jgi:hypothetical protein